LYKWVVGVGDTVEMDDKGRITLPVGVRRIVGKSVFKVELADKETIILRVLENKSRLVEKVKDIRLTGDKKRIYVDASAAKDYYGGVKY
jgi:DNA-binding transcriptional regulator/RsmH inhibitor MraZ